jgi:hypothetical protein
MPMQLSSEQSLRFFLAWVLEVVLASFFPQWGQNLAQRGAGSLQLGQESEGTTAPHSSQVIFMSLGPRGLFLPRESGGLGFAGGPDSAGKIFPRGNPVSSGGFRGIPRARLKLSKKTREMSKKPAKSPRAGKAPGGAGSVGRPDRPLGIAAAGRPDRKSARRGGRGPKNFENHSINGMIGKTVTPRRSPKSLSSGAFRSRRVRLAVIFRQRKKGGKSRDICLFRDFRKNAKNPRGPRHDTTTVR